MVEVDLHISIYRDGHVLLTQERVSLLRLVQSSGSLHLASQQLGISYNKAWKMIAAMNTATSSPVVEKVRGGRGGGGATLTDFGQLIMLEYDCIEHEVMDFKVKMNAEIRM